MRSPLLLSVLAFVFLLGACSSTEWLHRYKKKEEYLYDYNKCDKKVTDENNSGRMPLGGYRLNLEVEECLKKEGWRKVRR